ncbi:MAG: GNAT family N-acetyltransferase [Hyphomicrobiaceae bacterium]|nr:GNAT family N-acetyltransferase [Hyphomicrobiaceae bacterium]
MTETEKAPKAKAPLRGGKAKSRLRPVVKRARATTVSLAIEDDGALTGRASDGTFAAQSGGADTAGLVEIRVRHMHRRDLNRVWEFLKLVFRDVNRETVEYQRPRHKKHFLDIYEEEGIEQLVFEVKAEADGKHDLVGYAEYSYEIIGQDSWMNHRYFEKRDMRPLFVEEIAVHPSYHGIGIGSFMFEQIEHAARLRGCTHIVLEVAENNEEALRFYRKRSFQKLDAAIFLSRKLDTGGELLAPRTLKSKPKRK